MKKFVIFKKKLFESLEKYEDRLNEECRKGYRPVSMTSEYNGSLMVLLEKIN